MIVLLEEPEAWSLMMLVSAVAVDNAGLSDEGKEAIRRWRSDRAEGTPMLSELTEALNKALNAHLDAKFMRRVKSKGWYETVRR
ncbi:hypothetical protein [Tepidiforma sp.]|uniref:hypothetical protein n=1 Tax=Tepidiforma sp. TaxID=2682230 RepID=UPI002ADD71D0|nr:hypothetical protein [Tepidiforma sp.]